MARRSYQVGDLVAIAADHDPMGIDPDHGLDVPVTILGAPVTGSEGTSWLYPVQVNADELARGIRAGEVRIVSDHVIVNRLEGYYRRPHWPTVVGKAGRTIGAAIPLRPDSSPSDLTTPATSEKESN